MMLRSSFSLLLMLLLAAAPAAGQTADSLILQGKRMLEAGYDQGDAGTIQRAQALFLRTAEDERRAALAHYYAGLAGYRLLPLLEDDEDRQEQALDDAIGHLEAAAEDAPQMADAHALLSSLYGWKAGKQWYKAMFLGPKAGRAMERAKELAPENPRVVLLDAVGLFNKPGAFGGDKEEALRGFNRATRLFKQEHVEDPLAPRWGYADAYAWAGIAHMKADRPAKARQAFEWALQVNPDFGWVKNVLMPQLAASPADARE